MNKIYRTILIPFNWYESYVIRPLARFWTHLLFWTDNKFLRFILHTLLFFTTYMMLRVVCYFILEDNAISGILLLLHGWTVFGIIFNTQRPNK